MHAAVNEAWLSSPQKSSLHTTDVKFAQLPVYTVSTESTAVLPHRETVTLPAPCEVQEYQTSGLVAAAPQLAVPSLVAVSVDENWQAVLNFFAKGTKLMVLLDEERKTPALYGTEKFPETFILDKEGNVRFYVVSDRDWNAPDVRACIDALAAQ